MTIVGGGGARSLVREDGVPVHVDTGELLLESGYRLPHARLGYETWGRLNQDGSNAILIEHALTGDTHVARGRAREHAPEPERRAAEAGGWWDGLVGPGAALDTDRYFVVCANILGGCYGSTGPATPAPASVDPLQRPWGSRFPRITVRDTVRAEAALADALGIRRWKLVIGGSMGGARAMEWAVMYPSRVAACAVIAGNVRTSAEQLAWGQAQALAIRQDPDFRGGDYYGGPLPDAGLGLARRIAHITYRCAPELHARFGRETQPGESPEVTHTSQRGRYRVESYLDHHASKLAGRFDANSYLSVNETLMSHDVTRGRGTLEETLAGTECEWLVAAVDSDRLFLPAESAELVDALPGRQELHMLTSPSGHDGFLIETPQVGMLLHRTVLPEP